MLTFARRYGEVRFDDLMEVYSQSNQEAAARMCNIPPAFALEMAEQDFCQYLREVFFQTPGAIYIILEDDDRYVSAARLEPYRDGLLLAGLETRPSARKRGYATQLLQGIQKYLTKLGGKRLYSHVHKKNIPSLRLHEKLGFREISDMAVYLDGSVDNHSVTLCYDE